MSVWVITDTFEAKLDNIDKCEYYASSEQPARYRINFMTSEYGVYSTILSLVYADKKCFETACGKTREFMERYKRGTWERTLDLRTHSIK